MLKTVTARLRQGYRTIDYPKGPGQLPDRMRGRPVVKENCRPGCRDCADLCPVQAITFSERGPRIDLGGCLFCGRCADACCAGAISFPAEHRLAARAREDLWVEAGREYRLAQELDYAMKKLFGRSLKLRQVSAGGCNGCEVDINVLNTVVFDLGRFGIQIVASPRHADGLLVTGPVTRNMRLALEKTYAAVPKPKLVIAVGSCAIGGGPFAGSAQVLNGVSALLPVDLFIPGCPPHPLTILDGLLRLMGKLK